MKRAGMDKDAEQLCELAMRFPFRWFSMDDVSRMCGFGRNVVTALAARGAPIVARKANPHVLNRWLESHAADIGKLR